MLVNIIIQVPTCKPNLNLVHATAGTHQFTHVDATQMDNNNIIF